MSKTEAKPAPPKEDLVAKGLEGQDLTLNPFDSVKRYNSFEEVEFKKTAALPRVEPAIWEDLLWFQDDQLNEY